MSESGAGNGPNWRRIAMVTVGTWIAAWLSGVMEFVNWAISTVFGTVADLFRYISTLVAGLFAIPEDIQTAAWDSAAAFIAGFGPVAAPLAMVLVIITLYVGVRGMEAMLS